MFSELDNSLDVLDTSYASAYLFIGLPDSSEGQVFNSTSILGVLLASVERELTGKYRVPKPMDKQPLTKIRAEKYPG